MKQQESLTPASMAGLDWQTLVTTMAITEGSVLLTVSTLEPPAKDLSGAEETKYIRLASPTP